MTEYFRYYFHQSCVIVFNLHSPPNYSWQDTRIQRNPTVIYNSDLAALPDDICRNLQVNYKFTERGLI